MLKFSRTTKSYEIDSNFRIYLYIFEWTKKIESKKYWQIYQFYSNGSKAK